MKSFNLLIVAFVIILLLASCAKKEDSSADRQSVSSTDTKKEDAVGETQADNEPAPTAEWPSSVYPAPENCEINMVMPGQNGVMIFATWKDKDAVKAYVEILKDLGEEDMGTTDGESSYVFSSKHFNISYFGGDKMNGTIQIVE